MEKDSVPQVSRKDIEMAEKVNKYNVSSTIHPHSFVLNIVDMRCNVHSHNIFFLPTPCY